jgi:hypothetical protein
MGVGKIVTISPETDFTIPILSYIELTFKVQSD